MLINKKTWCRSLLCGGEMIRTESIYKEIKLIIYKCNQCTNELVVDITPKK